MNPQAEEILAKFNLKFEDLVGEEVDTYLKWLKDIERKQITPAKIEDHLTSLISAVQRELVDTEEFDYFFFGLFKRASRKQISLKGRLKNYLFLEIFISSPERAKQLLEAQLENLAAQIKESKNG